MKVEINRKYLWIAASVIAAVIYFVFDPLQSRLMPKCMFHLITGWDCPGCGMQRMIHALLHLDFRGAWQANAFLMGALPAILFMVYIDICRKRFPKLYCLINSPIMTGCWMALIIAWGIGRNIF